MYSGCRCCICASPPRSSLSPSPMNPWCQWGHLYCNSNSIQAHMALKILRVCWCAPFWSPSEPDEWLSASKQIRAALTWWRGREQDTYFNIIPTAQMWRWRCWSGSPRLEKSHLIARGHKPKPTFHRVRQNMLPLQLKAWLQKENNRAGMHKPSMCHTVSCGGVACAMCTFFLPPPQPLRTSPCLSLCTRTLSLSLYIPLLPRPITHSKTTRPTSCNVTIIIAADWQAAPLWALVGFQVKQNCLQSGVTREIVVKKKKGKTKKKLFTEKQAVGSYVTQNISLLLKHCKNIKTRPE